MLLKRHVKTGSLKDQNKSLRSIKASFECSSSQKIRKHQTQMQGAKALPTVTGPAPRQAGFGLSGRWAVAPPTPAADHSCRHGPPLPPKHPKTRRGQGQPTGGCPTNTVLCKAGEKKLQG